MTPATGSPDLGPGRSIERVVLVRRAPTTEGRRRLQRLVTNPERASVVFFQGEGVAWFAGAGPSDCLGESSEAWACIGSWRRRHSADPPGACRLASLAEWLDLLLPPSGGGPELICLGHGDPGTGALESASTTDLLFEIRHRPADDRDRLETLEPVLAAAGLELEVDVLFEGAGTAHLAGAGAERWNQLIDFDLGRLWSLQQERRCLPSVATRLARVPAPASSGGADAPASGESIDAEHLRRRARKIVGL